MTAPVIPFVTLDVFTEERFRGNQLAVVTLPDAEFITKSRKQEIAREFNFSETVFLHRRPADSSWAVDIFTPEAEMAFAGHPIIGTGHYLFSLPKDDSPTHHNPPEQNKLVLHTLSGPVSLVHDPAAQLVHASIPHNVHQHTQTPTTWDQLLPTQPHLRPIVARVPQWSPFPAVSIVKGVTYVLCDLTQSDDVFAAVKAGPSPQVPLDDGWGPSFVGVMYYRILEEADDVIKIRVRMIAINLEDPACGSGSSALCSYLALQRGAGRGNARLKFDLEEGTEIGRQSFIRVEVVLGEGGDSVKEVWLAGKAAFVTKGEFFGV
ncbi:putative isomerase [Lasiodiplodia theobromae]|uniref:Putative isomerase n=1 Tax=Lasiodiplodia theobromae TaxID=45133 RepID=A0A5N5D351_9PEZI|nr:putative isomerase [Lasiodiplodia theobromae]